MFKYENLKKLETLYVNLKYFKRNYFNKTFDLT